MMLIFLHDLIFEKILPFKNSFSELKMAMVCEIYLVKTNYV